MPSIAPPGRETHKVARRTGQSCVRPSQTPERPIALYASKWRPRVVVASMMMGPRDRLTIVNATPTGRPNSDIHLDALFDLDPNDCSRCRPRAAR